MSATVDETQIPPVTPPASPPAAIVGQGETFFTQADVQAAVEKARQQEKDKLYGKVDSLESKLTEITTAEAARIQAAELASQAAADAARLAAEEEMTARELLSTRDTEWQERLSQTEKSFEDRLAAMTTEREQERALAAKEQEFHLLQAYKAERLEAEKDSVAPQFHAFVGGNTQAEIESSIALAKEKSAEVAEQVQAAMQAAQSRGRGTSVSGYSPVGPVEFESGQRQLSAQDIQGMDMQEYAKHRQALIGRGATSNQGIFS